MNLRRVAALIAMVTALAVGFAPPAAAASTGFTFVDIPGQDGVVLKANWIAPATAGKHPAVIFPSSWGLNDAEYLAQAKAFAAGGYVVVSYTPRGWWGSGGDIDTAGPRDMADLSRVIDWTIANTPTDPARIGAAGVSYGAGISLLGSAFDTRIRAVGMLSGWTDLVYSLYGDQTRHRQSAGFLQLAAQLLGHPGPDLSGKLADFNADRNVDQVQAWAKVRSPASYVDQINTNNPAVLIENAWGDSFFPPDQLPGFFGKLTTPKRLELRPGDHAIAELTGLIGLPNAVWISLRRWMDQYLGGVETGIGNEPPVRLNDAESYASWAAMTSGTVRYSLGAPRLLDQTGRLGGAASTGWTKRIPAGLDTTADGGIVLITNGIAAFTGQPPQIWLPTVDRTRAGVWASERPGSRLSIRGIPHVHLNLAGSPPSGTVVAYLYDLDLLGNARLITHEPVTWNSGSGVVDFDLSAAAYDVPPGHSLTLVVDSADPLYYDANNGGTITIGGGSYVDVPVQAG
ncbi:CocE/NonD family hydrolase [Actinoplanes sp. NPDC051343]|uniref:CocE/NonD family hydrolase n=1 Tax=Actinoplanes sp. NPDC051343 TaxID=3363906 RepID=UPI0037AC0C40